MLPKSIFYSWQSDLPRNSNRIFIEEAIQGVLNGRKEDEIFLNESIDRDTLNVQGSVDIVATVFQKIDICSVFVADISLINPESGERKRTPNPNVLLELGYAVKTIGWDNILLMFNTAYGPITDLPFDLRQRRMFPYRLSPGEEKKKERIKLQGEISGIISGMLQAQVPSDVIKENIKVQIDTQLLYIGNHLHKILHHYGSFIDPHVFFELLTMKGPQINGLFEKGRPIGFQILKGWSIYKEKLDLIMENPNNMKYLDDTKRAALIELCNELALIDQNFQAVRFFRETLDRVGADYSIERTRVIDHYKLFLKEGDESHQIDQGDFFHSDESKLLVIFAPVRDESFVFTLLVEELLKKISAVLDSWNGLFMLNPATVIM